MKLNTGNLGWKQDSDAAGKSQAVESYASYQKATVAFLLLSSAVSFYIALFLVSSSSDFSYLLLVSGLARIVVAVFCWKGSLVAFRTASRLAIITALIDVLSSKNDISFATILYVIPQLFVIRFSQLTLAKMHKSSQSFGFLNFN